MVLDLEALDFSDSTILCVLVAAHRRQGVGGVLRLATPPPFMQRLSRITNLDTVIEINADLDSAMSA